MCSGHPAAADLEILTCRASCHGPHGSCRSLRVVAAKILQHLCFLNMSTSLAMLTQVEQTLHHNSAMVKKKLEAYHASESKDARYWRNEFRAILVYRHLLNHSCSHAEFILEGFCKPFCRYREEMPRRRSPVSSRSPLACQPCRGVQSG